MLYGGGGVLAVLVVVGAVIALRRRPKAEKVSEVTKVAPKGKKFCIYCGATLPAKAEFCQKCGKNQK